MARRTPDAQENSKQPTTGFLGNLHFYANRYNLTLDLSGVTYLTTDAIAALVATLVPFTRIPVFVRGSLPKDAAAQTMLVGSGFFDHFRSVQPIPPKLSGQIQQERSRKVQPDVARDLIHCDIKSISGKAMKCTPAYRVLIECMLNTHNHAAKEGARRETWWATVYADHGRKRVCFTFVDAGLGIFRSIRLRRLQMIYRRLGFRTDAAILRDMLLGKVESSTGISYRGKGLPSIYKLSQGGMIKSLVIIANDVYADVSAGVYKTLSVAFRGTLLYWEIDVH